MTAFWSPVDGKNVSCTRQNVNPNETSKVVCKDICDRHDLKLKEAEKTIANKDVIIRMLQEHVKKLETSYKHNLTETEDFRYKYCLATEQIKRLRSCPKHCRETPPKKDLTSTLGNSKQQQSTTAQNSLAFHRNDSPSNCSPDLDGCKALEKLMKDHYGMMQTLIDKIIERKDLVSKESDHLSLQVTQLQKEVARLREINGKLQEQLDDPVQFPSVKDSILETYQKMNSELHTTVEKLENLMPEQVPAEVVDDDQAAASSIVTFDDQPQRISFSSNDKKKVEPAVIIEKESDTEKNSKQGNNERPSTSKQENRSKLPVYRGGSFSDGSKRSSVSKGIQGKNISNNVTEETRRSRSGSGSCGRGTCRSTSTSSSIPRSRSGSCPKSKICRSSSVTKEDTSKLKSPTNKEDSIKNNNEKTRNGVGAKKCLGISGTCGCRGTPTEKMYKSTCKNKPSDKEHVAVSNNGDDKLNGSGKNVPVVEQETERDVIVSGYANVLPVAEITAEKSLDTYSEGDESTISKAKSDNSSQTAEAESNQLYAETEVVTETVVTETVVTETVTETTVVEEQNEAENREGNVTFCEVPEEKAILPTAETERNRQIGPTISTNIQKRFASISAVSDQSLVDVSNFSFQGKTEKRGVPTVPERNEQESAQTEEVEIGVSKQDTCSLLAATLTEIREKMVELVTIQENTCKEIEDVKNQVAVSYNSTKECSAQISKLTESVEGQKETFLGKFEENKTVIDDLKQTNEEIKTELAEVKVKIETLFKDVDELKEKQKDFEKLKRSNVSSETDDIITLEEFRHLISDKRHSNNETVTTIGERTRNETCDMGESTRTSLNENEKIRKDKQIKCLNELICYYSKINKDISTMCPNMVSTCGPRGIENHLKTLKGDDDVNDCIDKIKEENHKLKTTISCVIEHLEDKMKELRPKISRENIKNKELCGCKSESSSICLNLPDQAPQDHPEIQIEDIYNAVLRSISPLKNGKNEDSSAYSCKSVKSITCCCNVNIEHFVDGIKSGQEVNLEDVYKAVQCSCNPQEKKVQQLLPVKGLAQIQSDKSMGDSIKSKEDSQSQTSCKCLGHCFLDLEHNFSEGKLIITNLQTYVQYLHEQLQVITNIENQIEDLRTDIKTP